MMDVSKDLKTGYSLDIFIILTCSVQLFTANTFPPCLPPTLLPLMLRRWSVRESMFFLSTHLPSVLIKGLKQLHENQKNNPVLLENKSGSGVPNSNCNSSVQHVQIRVARLEDNTAISPSPMAALQIPVQITHVCKCWHLKTPCHWPL